jgi:lipoprotein-anchoring transpeptidase ErfK/SrfK
MRQAFLAGAAALAISTCLTSLPAFAAEPAATPATGTAAAPAVLNEAAKVTEAAKPTEAAAAATVAPAPAAAAGAAAAVTESADAKAEAAPAVVAKPEPPPTTLRVSIDLSAQRMTVSENGQVVHTWPVSSGRAGYRTPNGSFRPTWMSKMHYSRKYDNAPMPHAVFFTGGFAIHGTYATGMLGRPASHGCVRLAPSNAKTLFGMVSRHGRAQTQIALHGAAKDSSPRVARTSRVKPKSYAGGDFWGFGYADAPAVVKPQRRYRSVATSSAVSPAYAQPKVVYRNGQAYMYVGPKAAKQYWRKNAYSGGYSSY